MNGPWDPAGVSAYVGQLLVNDYFNSTFGRDSVDDAGAPLISFVHVGQNHANASWRGTAMFYGDTKPNRTSIRHR